jgi:hypothetical protein
MLATITLKEFDGIALHLESRFEGGFPAHVYSYDAGDWKMVYMDDDPASCRMIMT